MPCDGGPKLHLPALALVVLGLLLPGCGGSTDTVTAKEAPVLGGEAAYTRPASARATARSAGLAVTLTATPTRAKTGSPVAFNLTVYVPYASGALGYQLRYGDGTSAGQGAVPLFCIEGGGAPRHQTWRLTHRYKAAGRYRVSAIVYVNCTSDHATATVAVDVT